MTVLRKNFYPAPESTLNGKTLAPRVSKYNFDMLKEVSDPRLGVQGDWLEFANTLHGDTVEHVRRTAALATSAANIFMKRSLESGNGKFKEYRISIRTYTDYDTLGNEGRVCGAALTPR